MLQVGLTTLFVCLKLGDAIDWSWWIIFSPIIVATSMELVGMLVTCGKE